MRISDWSSDVCSSDLVLQAVADVAVGVVGDLDRAVPVAGEGDEDDRLRAGLDLGDDRLLDLVGEPAAHPADPIADVAGRHVGIGAQQAPDGDAAGLRAADRLPDLDALDAGDRRLEALGPLTPEYLRAG